MFQATILDIAIAAFIDKRRPLADGTYPVRIRVNQKKNRQFFPTGVSLTNEEWEKLPGTKNRELNKTKDIIQFAFNHIKDIVNELVKEDNFSLDQLNIRLGKGIDATVNIAFEARIEKFKIEEKYGTSELSKYSLRSVEAFAGKNIKFSKITVDWLKGLEKNMLSEGKSYTTISMYIRQLQAVVNEAKRQGIIKPHQYPFGAGKYEIPKHAGRNKALTKGEMKQIFFYDSYCQTIEYYRDLWLFSYLCNGANISDICNMKFDNIRNGNIEFYRQKTITKSKIKKTIVVVVTSEMQNIIDKWGNKSGNKNDYIFPVLMGNETAFEKRKKIKSFNRSMNHYLKKIGKHLGIDDITSYTARHTFATILKRSGTHIAFISESLGHSDVRITESYLASFEDEERKKNAALLTNFS